MGWISRLWGAPPALERRIAILAQLAEWERAEDAAQRAGFYETATQTPDGWRHVER